MGNPGLTHLRDGLIVAGGNSCNEGKPPTMATFTLPPLRFPRYHSSLPYACQVNPQLPQVVGFRPANKANSPNGNRHIETMIVHAGKPACEVMVVHLGQETTAMRSPYKRLSFVIHTTHKLKEAQKFINREHRSIQAPTLDDDEQIANGRTKI